MRREFFALCFVALASRPVAVLADELAAERPAEASAVLTECGSPAARVKIAALQDYQPTYSTFNFPADGQGHFDSLMTTTVVVGPDTGHLA